MTHDGYYEYYEKRGNWDFDRFRIESEYLTAWDLYGLLAAIAGPDSRVLDLGTEAARKSSTTSPDVPR